MYGSEFGGGAPRQEIEKMPTAPDISKPLELLRKNFWQYRGLTPERKVAMEKAFQQDFAQLGEREKKSISLELQSIELEIALYADKDDGIATIREEDAAERVRQVLERTGVVMSAEEGALEVAKKELLKLADDAIHFMREKEDYAQQALGKSERIQEQAKSVLLYSSAIKDEFQRLELVQLGPEPASVKKSGKGERNSRDWQDARLNIFRSTIKNTADMRGVIGFDLLNKLVNEYGSAVHYLEETERMTESDVVEEE